MIKPISPNEVALEKEKGIPDEIIECWNRLIAAEWDGQTSRVTLSEAKKNIARAWGCSIEDIETAWLNIEPIYRAAGWKVIYESPSYDECFPPYYSFTKK